LRFKKKKQNLIRKLRKKRTTAIIDSKVGYVIGKAVTKTYCTTNINDFHEKYFEALTTSAGEGPTECPRAVGKSCASRKHANTMTIGTAVLAEVGLSEKR